MFMISLCTRYWEVLLAQGICVGLGTGMLGLLSVSVLPGWWVKKRMVVTGIAATGSGVGKLLWFPAPGGEHGGQSRCIENLCVERG